jgi:hypothetical protein
MFVRKIEEMVLILMPGIRLEKHGTSTELVVQDSNGICVVEYRPTYNTKQDKKMLTNPWMYSILLPKKVVWSILFSNNCSRSQLWHEIVYQQL